MSLLHENDHQSLEEVVDNLRQTYKTEAHAQAHQTLNNVLIVIFFKLT